MSDLPRFTFGIIVLNNEPFTRYLLRQLYPFAHQIIVVEGAAPASSHAADPRGHSTDGTQEALRRFRAEEDPDGKVTVVTAEDEGHPDGFWPGEKEEMSAAYARRATGDWLWQVDGDEFYREADLQEVVRLVREYPDASTMSFRLRTFWGSLEYYADGPFLRGRSVGCECHRLFRWKPGFRYVSHRPATVVDADGVDLRRKSWLDHRFTARRGICLFHYSLLFPRQVMEKAQYYVNRRVPTRERDVEWAEACWLRLSDPFRVHNCQDYPAWLERYSGRHPEQIELMWQDIQAGRLSMPTRDMADVERLMRDPVFRLERALLRCWPPHEWNLRRGGYRLDQVFYRMASRFGSRWRRAA